VVVSTITIHASDAFYISATMIGWTGVIIVGVVRYIRKANESLLDETLKSLKNELRVELEKMRSEIYSDLYKRSSNA